MNIATFIEQFYLHDSSINNIGYEFFKNQFVITINMCNWMQDNFKEGQDPDHLIGNFIFKDAQEIKECPSGLLLHSNEILEVHLEQSHNDLDKLTFFIMIFDPSTPYKQSKPIVSLSFKAKEVEWIPIESYFD